MIASRCLTFAFALAVGPGCGDDSRNDPAPIGMSAGSATVGGSASASASATAGGTTGAPDPTAAPTMGSTIADSSTGDAVDTSAGSGPGSPPTGEGTTAGACEQAGGACEGDGVCVEQIDNNGLMIVCSHGGAGEPCSLDRHCDSAMCVAEVTGAGVVSTCA